jgi:hypothetical protein
MVDEGFGIRAFVGLKSEHWQQEIRQSFCLCRLELIFLFKELLKAPILEKSEGISCKEMKLVTLY